MWCISSLACVCCGHAALDCWLVLHRVDLRWRRKPEELSQLAALQVSTCSLEARGLDGLVISAGWLTADRPNYSCMDSW